MEVSVNQRRAEWRMEVALPPGFADDQENGSIRYRPGAVRVHVWNHGDGLRSGTAVIVGRRINKGGALGAEYAEEAFGKKSDLPWVQAAVKAAVGQAEGETWKAGASAEK